MWAVPDPTSRAAVGGGVFNLVRRKALLSTKGFEWLKLEVADDVSLAQMCKRAGFKIQVYVCPDEVSLAYYRSVGEAMHGLEKNMFAVFKFRTGLAVAVCSLMLWLEAGPLLGLLMPGPARWMALVALAISSLVQVVVACWTGRRILPAAIPVVGASLLVVFMMRATWLTLRRGGICWRGTRYALQDLRAGSRLELL
jgi:hypothetical protein